MAPRKTSTAVESKTKSKIVKHLMFTAYYETDDPHAVGAKVYRERLLRLGDEVDPSTLRPQDLERGLHPDIDAFYTDAEAEQIRKGNYRGADADNVFAARRGERPAPIIEPAEGEHGDFALMDAVALGQHIQENRLTVDETLALVPEDAEADDLQKVIDAENIATSNTPRSGVVDPLEKRIIDLGD